MQALSFQGSIVLGMGFTFDDTPDADDVTSGTPSPIATMQRLIAHNADNRAAIKPYVGGDEVNSDPQHQHHRYVIDFGSNTEESCRARWPDLMRIIEQKVRPDRLGQNRDSYRKYWWQFAEKRQELYSRVKAVKRVLAHAFVSKYCQFCFLNNDIVYAGPMPVFLLESNSAFGVLQSTAHSSWVGLFAATLEDRLKYPASDCFETFPFPANFESDVGLEAAGREYYEFRAALMVKNDEGLTKTYNRFHDPGEASAEIARLRELHAAMDRAVLDAYGWQDVQPVCGFALDWLDLDDDELADTLASAPDDIRERIESADYFFPDTASACRFQSNIKKDGKGKLPWRYRWPDDTRDDILARLLALNAQRAELERLTGLPGASPATPNRDPASATPEDSDSTAAPPAKAKRAKKDSKRATKKSALRPMFDEADE
jgi:hypothetical protein